MILRKKMKALHKELLLVGLLVFFAFLFWLSLSVLFRAIPNVGMSVGISAALAFLLMLVCWGTIAILAESTGLVIVAWALVSFGGTLWIREPVFIVAASLCFVAGIVAYLRTKSELQNTLNGGLVRPLRKALPLTVTFLAITVSAAAYFAAPIAALPLETFLKEDAFNAFIGRTVAPMLRQVDASFHMDEAMSRELYRATLGFLEQRAGTYEKILPITFAIALFAMLRLAGIVLYWIALFIVFLLLRLMHRTGIIELRAVPATITAYAFP